MVTTREFTKYITVLMPGRTSRNGGPPMADPSAVLDAQPVAKRRLGILKYKEIEYIIQRIGRIELPESGGEKAAYQLKVDPLESGSLAAERSLEQVSNSDIIIAYIGEPRLFSDSVNVIYELAVRIVLKPELILLGQLVDREELEERIGSYLTFYSPVNVPIADGDEILQLQQQIARDTTGYPLEEEYSCAIPDTLKSAIDRGLDHPLELALRTSITDAIRTPPHPNQFTKFFETLGPQRLVSTSRCYLPTSMVKVTFAPREPGQDAYRPDQMLQMVTCDYDSGFEGLFAFKRDGAPVDDDFLFGQMEGFVDPKNLKEFMMDQEKLFHQIVLRPGVGTAKVPLLITDGHPITTLHDQEYLPSTILMKRMGDPSRVHHYLMLVVYFDVGRWRKKLREDLPDRTGRCRGVPTVYDDKILRITMREETIPQTWCGRALYLGDEGARAWLDILGDEAYTLADSAAFGMRSMRQEALSLVAPEVETVVSLGPGGGEGDADLMNLFARTRDRVRYIPVDISTGLLAMSVRKLQDRVEMPVAILGDFEADFLSVDRALQDYAGRPKPVLFSLLGGSFGNFNRAGALFLRNVFPYLQTGDHFLMDVPIAGPAWTPERDERMAKDTFDEPFKRFLAGGLARIDPRVDAASYPSWFDERIECVCSPTDDVPGTQVISIRDRSTRRVLLHFNRFRWDPLLAWLKEQGFTALYAKHSLKSDRDTFGMGLVLLARGSDEAAAGALPGKGV